MEASWTEKNWDFRAPEYCQQETENTEHTVLKKTKNTHPKKRHQEVFFFLLCFGNRLSFPVNEKEDICISIIQ